MGFRIVHVYGLTETYGPYSVNAYRAEDLGGDDRSAKQARQGVGMICADRMRVVDKDMNDVPRDGAALGEVVMRGNNVMKGYWDDPESTEKAFAGGWFHSGDLGVMHADGYVELRDRAKDVVISGGENISTIEVEQAVVSHPAVLEAAVIGVPDEQWGERPKAFVVLGEGESATPGRADRAREDEDRPLQGAAGRGDRRGAAQDVHRQGAEVRAAREGVGRAHQPGQLSRRASASASYGACTFASLSK